MAKVQIPCFDISELGEPSAEGEAELFRRIDEAYGPEGPGILCVKGEEIHEKVQKIRAQFLPQAVGLTDLPPEARERISDGETPLTNGLSRGAEVTDRAKSSFYYHPVTDTPGEHLPKGAAHVPLFHNANLFPSEEELPGFKANAREAAQFVVGVGHLLAQLIDRRLEKVPGYAKGKLAATVRTGPDSNHKCRLLRYHPYESDEEVSKTKGMWAAPHLDTGSLTGLVPGVFLDAEGKTTVAPDADTGLFVMNRQGEPLKAEVPPGTGEALLFQIGESLQIISGGALQATPHYVAGPKKATPGGASRCSLAIFMQPQPHEDLPIPEGMSHADVAGRSADRHLPAEWPSLAWRFNKLGLKSGDVLTFGQHGMVTFSNLGAATD